MKVEYNQLIDAFLERPNRDSIICGSTVPEWCPIFENHFPGNPILPGAILIEMMAQTGGFIHMLETNFSQMGYLAGVRSAKFRSSVGAGQEVKIITRVTHWGDSYLVSKSKVCSKAGKIFAESCLTIGFQDFQSDEIRSNFVHVLKDKKPGLFQYLF